MVTAADAHYGRSVRVSPTSNYRLRLPNHPGLCRFYDVNPGFAGLKVILPDARILATGGPVYTLYNRHASTSMAIVGNDGETLVTTMSVGYVVQLFLLDNTTQNGSWAFVHTASARGAELTLGREPWSVTIDSTQSGGFDCRAWLDARGYEGINPVALTVTVTEGTILGAPDILTPALTTGDFPEGSTCLLINHGIITGHGGEGGRGGDAGAPLAGEPPEPGLAGGLALRLRLTTGGVNYGTVAGGGGGGGGASGNSTQGGGGGGGGSGFGVGRGGAAPTSGGGVAGADGGVGGGGLGGSGAATGGTGGAPGAVGGVGGGGGAFGGAAGAAIALKIGENLSVVRAGTIAGALVGEA